jgi:CheY-like chemotaxis protein
MPLSGPILIVDDDPDDQDMIERILSKMSVDIERKQFMDGEKLLHYLRTTMENPSLIICDINMPIMSGIQLKAEIDRDPDLRQKKIPFIFLSTTANPLQVRKAYEHSIQGFFVKGQSYDALKNSVENIIRYWKDCFHPSGFEN